jgi:hypothetical protein
VAKLDRDIIIGKVGCLFTRRLSSGDKAQEGNYVTVPTIQAMLLICKKERNICLCDPPVGGDNVVRLPKVKQR